MLDVALHFVFPLLSHECLAHAVRYRAFVERLVGLYGHLDFVAHAHEQEAALSAVDCDLPDYLVEALGVELFPDRADAGFSGLLRLQPLVQVVLEVDHVDTRGRCGRDVTHPQLAILRVLSWWQDRVKVILIPCRTCLF